MEQRIAASAPGSPFVLPSVPGYLGGIVLAHRLREEVLSISIWESEGTARASEDREDVRRSHPYHLEGDMTVDYFRLLKVSLMSPASPRGARVLRVDAPDQQSDAALEARTLREQGQPNGVGELVLVGDAVAQVVELFPREPSPDEYEVIRWTPEGWAMRAT